MPVKIIIPNENNVSAHSSRRAADRDAANCRLADEYDAAQARGEIAKHGEVGRGRVSKKETLASANDIGLAPKQILAARQVRDAESCHILSLHIRIYGA